MFVTKRAIPRRTVLRGLGTAIALPLLDGMVPALTALAQTPARPARRMGVVYVPNGMNVWQFIPEKTGQLELTPLLRPLAAFRDQMVVLSGMRSEVAYAREGEGGGSHSRSQAAFMTGVHPKKTEGSDIQAGISVDQIAAKEFSQQTQLASLELALESVDLVGSCDIGYACAYTGTLAWRNPTTPLPMEIDPRAVFERLFGASDSTDPRARMARIRKDRSILDSVTQQMERLQVGLGPRDRTKLEEYVEAVRDIERRIQLAESQSGQELPAVEQPAGIPPTFEEHAKLMFDLMALAYQTDLTRVATFMMGREISVRTYPEIGVPEPHHPVSHHAGNAGQLEKLAKINAYHLTMFSHFLEKLRATPDGDGSLLDHSLIVYGAGISNSDVHLNDDLPVLLVGGASAGVKGGRHLRYDNKPPVSNLHLTVLDKLGVDVEKFGDSTGKLELLADI